MRTLEAIVTLFGFSPQNGNKNYHQSESKNVNAESQTAEKS